MLPEREKNLDRNKQVVFENRLSDWREIRNKKLSDSDIKFFILLEQFIMSMPDDDRNKDLKDLIIYRNKLRDITKWDNFDTIKDEIEMMDYLPDILK